MPTNLMPYEEELQVEPGLLGRLGRVGLSGVAAVGSALDVPGAAVRSLLAGQAPVSLLPWNWMDQDGRISGRGLLRKYGIVGDEDNYGNFFGGMAAEIALDPLTFVGLGALAKGTQAAGTGARGLLRASVPFTKTGIEIGTGARAEQIAKGLGMVPDLLTKPSKLAPVLEQAAKYVPGAKATSGSGDVVQTFYRAEKPGGTAFAPGNINTGNYWFDSRASAEDWASKNLPGANIYEAGLTLKEMMGVAQDANMPGRGAYILPSSARSKMRSADDGIDIVRMYEKGKPVSSVDHLRTQSTDMLQRDYDELVKQYDVTDTADPAYDSLLAKIDTYNRVLGERSKGSQQLDINALLKSNPGKIVDSNIPAVDINDVASIVPQNVELPVADWAKEAARMITAPGRLGLGLFSKSAGFKLTGKGGLDFSEEAQDLARATWRNMGEAHQKAIDAATGFVDEYHTYEQAFAESFGTDIAKMLPAEHAKDIRNVAAKVKNVTERLFRHAAETDDAERAVKLFDLDPDKAAPGLLASISTLGRRMKQVNREVYDAYLEMGGIGATIPKIDEEVLEMAELGALPGFEHFPRFGAEHPDSIMRAIKSGATRSPNSASRLAPLREVPAEIIERIGKLVQGMKAEGLKEDQWAKTIEDKYGEWLNRAKQTVKNAEGEDEVVSVWGTPAKHAEELAKWAGNANTFATYLSDNLRAESRYFSGLFSAQANMGAIYEIVKGSIGRRPMTEKVEGVARGVTQLRGLLDATKSLDGVPTVMVADVFQNAGMDVEKSLKWLAKEMGDASDEAIAQLRDHGAIPDSIGQAIVGSRQAATIPEWSHTLAQIVDIPTRWFKENVTLPFASFAMRNLGSGQYLIASSGVLNGLDGLKSYGTEFYKAFDDFRHGRISPEQQREWFANGVLHEDMLFEGVETRMGKFGHVAPEGINLRESWFASGEQIEPSILDRIPGLRPARQAQGTVLDVGGKFNRFIEYLNRVPLYEHLKKQGWSPEDAAKKVAELQVDYTAHNFSPFENQVMKRLMPFYSWQRKIGPVILGTLARNPAGLMGQTIRASRLASSDDPSMPEWMGETLAIENPLGSSEPGGKSYITGLGLPHEGPLAYFGGGLRGAGREVLSQLNPLIKAPLEWSTGTSFFQSGPGGGGRPLDELNPPIGQTLANVARFAGRDPSTPVPTPDLAEFAVANSPLSRYVTTARQVTDPRKHPLSLAANLLTGIRATDVSPQAQDAILRGRANELMRDMGAREFRQSYFPKNAPPADQDTAASLRELLNELAKRGRQRKAALAE